MEEPNKVSCPVIHPTTRLTIRVHIYVPWESTIHVHKMQCDNSAIPYATSKWKKEALDLLNAKFEPRSVSDFTFDGLVKYDSFF